jgi:hypothetical protein
VAVVREGKSKIIIGSNFGVLAWPTTAVVKISPAQLPLLLSMHVSDRQPAPRLPLNRSNIFEQSSFFYSIILRLSNT